MEYLKNIMSNKISPPNNKFLNLIKLIPQINSLSQTEALIIENESKKRHDDLNKYFVTPLTNELIKGRDIVSQENKEFKKRITDNKILLIAKEKVKSQLLAMLKLQNPFFEDITISDANWLHVELYINSRVAFFHKLKLDKVMKIRETDATDLFQLIYVNENYLYWSADNAWKDIIRKASMGHFLFDNQ